MRKKEFYKDKLGRLYSKRESKNGLKKVYRSIDEISMNTYYGRYMDKPFDGDSWFSMVGEISSKQLRNKKINKQMIALGLL